MQINEAATAVFGGPDHPPHPRGLGHQRRGRRGPGAQAGRRRRRAGGRRLLAERRDRQRGRGRHGPRRVLQISQSSTSPLLSVLDDDGFLFRTTASDALQGVVAAQLARRDLRGYAFERAATIYVNSPYGQGLSNAFARAFEARGGTVTAEVAHPDRAAADLRGAARAGVRRRSRDGGGDRLPRPGDRVPGRGAGPVRLHQLPVRRRHPVRADHRGHGR
jgi:hypothetical protein